MAGAIRPVARDASQFCYILWYNLPTVPIKMRITHIVLRSFIYVQVKCSVCFDAQVGLLEYQQSSTTPVYVPFFF